jgi:hypothetical protein
MTQPSIPGSSEYDVYSCTLFFPGGPRHETVNGYRIGFLGDFPAILAAAYNILKHVPHQIKAL